MRIGARVKVNTPKHALHHKQEGVYVRRDWKRFLMFCVKLDSGPEVWFAACHLIELRPAKARLH